ncbi:MAG: 23S rRNA (pseudouridine(1915)-N(3))-methyltransferase RlmH [Fervidobacterium sp.]|nr:23S rRNA (pseudouridine(1915)-N(3))-methyltransferase RlmH [Fervidobacterium sp.]
MKVEIIVPGKISKHLQSALEYYLDKLERFANVQITFVDLGGDVNTQEPKIIIKREAENIKKKLKDRKYILIDLWGREFSSEEFASKIESIINNFSEIIFVVGGPVGIDNSIRNDALFSISFSRMTFTHEMCVVLLLEQLFRAFKIIKNEKYHY